MDLVERLISWLSPNSLIGELRETNRNLTLTVRAVNEQLLVNQRTGTETNQKLGRVNDQLIANNALMLRIDGRLSASTGGPFVV